MDTYAPGLLVVPRQIKGDAPARGGRRGRTRQGWTLHRPDCLHVARAHETLPVPPDGYPDTIPCAACKPGDPHQVTAVEVESGRWQTSCAACDVVGIGGVKRSAYLSSDRRHAQVAAAAELEAARAALPEGQQLLVIVPRGAKIPGLDQRGWTRHRVACSVVPRAKEVWPAPETSRPGTVDCEYCRPLGQHSPTYADAGGGKVRGRCACGHDSGEAPSQAAAYNRLTRLHATQPDGPQQ